MAYSKKKLRTEYGVFAQQYARKKDSRYDSNDRRYDRKLEEKIKKMKVEELAELLTDDDNSVGEKY